MENHDGGGVGTEVNKHTTTALLDRSEDCIGKGKGGKIYLGYLDVGYLEAGVELLIVALALQDVEEIALKALALHSYRLCLHEVVCLIFLHLYVENFLLWVFHGAVLVHHIDDELLSNRYVASYFLGNDIEVGVDRLTSHTDIYVLDI